MKIEYRISASVVTDEDGLPHDTYGIELWKNNERIRAVNDVSLDCAGITNVVNLCNELDLDPIHLDDVIEDFFL